MRQLELGVYWDMLYGTVAASILICTLLAPPVAAAESAGDPWRGKHQDEVTSVLGWPDKTKSSGDGRLLVYKLLVPGESPPLDPRIRLLQLPGVGLVAQMVRPEVPDGGEMDFQPTQFDKEGRQVEGGYARQSSTSMSFDPKTGKLESDLESGPDPGKVKKITLKFELDGDDRVRSWSVSPKKFLKGN